MKTYSLNCRGKLLDLTEPVVMGILNTTPDSFFDGGRFTGLDAALLKAEKMLRQGAVLLDVGGASSRPGAEVVPEDEEKQRVLPLIEAIVRRFPEAFVSVDTWRVSVAREAVAAGAHLVNDISAGRLDTSENMYETVGALQVPYILMHMSGSPDNMQQNPAYTDVNTEVLDFFIREISRLHAAGVYDLVLDPGFGFGKTVEHNYRLLNGLHVFENVTGLLVLAGLSRKSMICKVLKVNPENALNGTTALHMVALQQGARILRVHDVKEAVECVKLWKVVNGGV
ncbi:MAG: dihydropteroate synthase [Saprospiraceae bacterium]|nr:dihydropteroate synthase [Saprospiraceae bacterium]